MTKRPVSSTPVPGWEKLLQRLYFVEESPKLSRAQLQLLRFLTDPDLTLRKAFERIVLILPKLTSAQAVLIYKQTDQGPTLITTNLSASQGTKLLAFNDLTKSIRTRGVSQFRIGRISLKNTKRRFNFVTAFSIDEKRALNVRLLSETPLGADERELLKVTWQSLVLRNQKRVLKKQLDREAESLTILTQHLSEGMAVIDQNLRITLWNRPMQRLTGISPRQAIGSYYAEVIQRPDNPEWLKELIDEYKDTPLRNVFATEFMITSGKERKWIQVSGSFFRRSEHDIEQTILIARDVSHTKLLETRKNEFISIATHELRTPITAIKGYLSLLARIQDNLTDQQKMYLQRAVEANHRLVNLAEDLLRVVQVEEDRLRINLRPIELYPILEKVTHDLAQKAESKGLSITLEKPTFSTMVIADPEKIEQVFANLVDNAIKYTNRGEVTLRVTRTEETGQAYVKTDVSDTGIGIHSRSFQDIFEKFRRTHSPEQARESGAGLGLFIVKSFVEKQGGKISLKSRVGRGTTFSVLLPASEGERKNETQRTEK